MPAPSSGPGAQRTAGHGRPGHGQSLPAEGVGQPGGDGARRAEHGPPQTTAYGRRKADPRGGIGQRCCYQPKVRAGPRRCHGVTARSRTHGGEAAPARRPVGTQPASRHPAPGTCGGSAERIATLQRLGQPGEPPHGQTGADRVTGAQQGAEVGVVQRPERGGIEVVPARVGARPPGAAEEYAYGRRSRPAERERSPCVAHGRSVRRFPAPLPAIRPTLVNPRPTR